MFDLLLKNLLLQNHENVSISQTSKKIFIKKWHIEIKNENFTKDIVSKEILLSKVLSLLFFYHIWWYVYFNIT